MSKEKIIIKIDEKGELVLETKGIKGPTCLDEALKLIEELALVTEVRKTDEYYMGGKVKVQTNATVDVRK